MRRNAAPAGAVGFDHVFGCRRAMPPRAVRAWIGPFSIPLSPARIARIGVLGDTGCRLTTSQIQACDDPSAWPLVRVAASLTRARPDVVVHVGDYFYREAACPAERRAACGGSPPPNPAGSPNEDNWASWRADLLRQVGPLMRTAPILFVRGNHEVCARGGVGYFLLLEPRYAERNRCAPVPDGRGGLRARPDTDQTPAYGVRAGDVSVAVVDSSGDDDSEVTDAGQAARQFREVRRIAAAGRRTLLATHRPVFGYLRFLDATGGPVATWDNASLQGGLREVPLRGAVDLFLAGHIHTFQAVGIPGQPPQFVFGNGGTLLEDPAPALPAFPPLAAPDVGSGPEVVPYPQPSSATDVNAFGFGILRPRPRGGWRVDARGVDGRLQARCATTPASVRCARPR